MAGEPRILVVTPDFPPAPGGIQLVAHRIVCLAERLRCRVVTLDGAAAGRFEADEGLDVVRVPAVGLDHRLSIARLNAAALREAVRFRPHAVLSAHIVLAPAACALRRRLGLPFVQYLYAEELIHRRRLVAFALGRAAVGIAVSRYTRELAAGLGADTTRVRVIPAGVDLPTGRRGERSPRPTVVTVARLDDHYKGHDTLVRALPLVLGAVPDARWVVVGDGRLRPWLERLAAAHGVEGRVFFLGRLPDAERDAWLDRAHVFAMPARVPAGGGGEGFGIAFLEAGGHGLPVVAGNVGGARDAVLDGETGVLVDPADHVAVASAITELLLDPARAATIGRAGADRARALAWPQVVRRVEDVMLEVAHGG
jgi:phosphatidylinositol alpha-1,6-mannosyltransferase